MRRKVGGLTLLNWVELIIGAVLPTLCLAPLAVVWLVSSCLGGWEFFRAGLIGTLFAVVGLLAFAALWIVVLCRPERIKQSPATRWAIVASGVSGVLLGGFFLYSSIEYITRVGRRAGGDLPAAFRDQWGWLLLIGPMVIGLRYLRLLVRNSGDRMLNSRSRGSP